MTDPERTSPKLQPASRQGSAHEMEEYAGGYIQAWVGHIPVWLLVVYAVLFIWALYYGCHILGRARAGTTISGEAAIDGPTESYVAKR